MTHDSIKKLIEIMEQTEAKINAETNENAKKFYWDIIEGISEVLMNEGICPTCGEELKAKSFQEDRRECHGFPSYETVEVYVCENGHQFE